MAKTRKLIIIIRKEHIKKYLKEIDDYTTIVAWNEEICQELKKRKIKYKKVNSRYNKDISVNWIKDLARKRFKNKNLIDIFEFEETSIWWWMEYWLYKSYAFYDPFNSIIENFYLIYNIITNENPNEITYVKEGLLTDETIKLIANKLSIKTRVIHSYKLLQFKIAKTAKIALIKQYFHFRCILRKLISNFVLRIPKKNDSEIKRLLFLYIHDDRQEEYLQPIFKKFRNSKYTIYALDIPSGSVFLDMRVLRRKIRNKAIKHILLENYICRKDMDYINRKTREFVRLWGSLKAEKNFQQIFEFKGVNIWNLIKPQLSCYFKVRLKHHLIALIAVNNAIKSLHPNIAVTPGETTEFGKCLFIACQKRDIPCIGIQHGMLQDLRCIHRKNEVSLKEIKTDYCPIPTITGVYGKNDKDFLIKKGNYPENSVVITGNQRYDKLANINKKFNKNLICRKLKLNPNKKIVVLATQPFSSIRDREILTKVVYDAVWDNRDIQLIIKVHPEEKISFYKKLVREKKNNAITTKYNTFKVLYIADILVTVSSTIGLEAAILGKPIISISSMEDYDIVDYAERGIAIEVHDAKSLRRAIKKILYDKKTKNQLTKKINKYVYEHCYKIDGKASERIARLIKNKLR